MWMNKCESDKTGSGFTLYMADKVLFWQSLVKLVDFHKNDWPFFIIASHLFCNKNVLAFLLLCSV